MSMAQEETDTADEEEYEQRAWVNATPTVRISGEPIEIFTPQLIDGDTRQTDSSYGVVLRNPEVVVGNLYENDARDGDLARENVDEDSTNPTDYRVADPDDKSVTVVGDTLVTDEESTVDGELANEYSEADAFEEDEILLWVGGLSGDRIIRSLDFNGRPYAQYGDNGPVYGLFQAHEEWFTDPSNRGSLASDGKAPRVTRPPILRPDIDSVLIDISASDSGKHRSYRGNVFRTDEFEAEFGDLTTPTADLPTGQYGIDADSRLELRMADFEEANDVIESQEWSVHEMFYEGDGWGQVPDEYGTTNFDTSMDIDDNDADSGSSDIDEFVSGVVEQMQGTEAAHGKTPDEVYSGGLEGLVERNEGEFSESPDIDEIRQAIYTEVTWLSAEDLE